MGAYRTGEYAATLDEFGRPRQLGASGGWVIERPIPRSADRDAIGCYPMFASRDRSRLADDHRMLSDLVSLVLVADPFGDFEPSALAGSFNRGVVPFKRHHVVELGPTVETFIDPHHRRNARKALGLVEVERVDRPLDRLDDWVELYDHLIARHEIQGMARFSRRSFAGLFALPGLIAFRAEAVGATVGMLLWLIDGDVAYYHLGAYSDEGYARRASFALFWRSIEWFGGRVRWLDLGAGAGVGPGDGGLDRFKAGWANATRTAYLCRHVYQADRYDELARQAGTEGSTFFPSYRAPDPGRSLTTQVPVLATDRSP
jgi:hypothetical protein